MTTSTTETTTTVARQFEMRNGAQNNYFTLWSVCSSGRYYSEHYICNLSVNYEEAIAKAEAWAKKTGLEFFDASHDNRPILYGPDVLRFGKYYGERVNDLEDEGYLTWLATKCDNLDPELKAAARGRCIALGLLVEYKGELLPIRLANYLQNKEKMQGHHFANGEKVKNITGTVMGVRSFEVSYGYQSSLCFIIEFKTVDNKLITYKGSKCEYDAKFPEGVYFDQVFGKANRIEKGDEVILSGTIEHGQYKEVNQTYIKRPKFNVTEEMQFVINNFQTK